MKAILFVLLTGCMGPRYYMQPTELKNIKTPIVWARITGGRTITKTGAFTFLKDKRESPLVYAKSLLVGDEGVCLDSGISPTKFWRAIRLEYVDPRLFNRVLQPRAGITIDHTEELTWEIRGGGGALRDWLREHLRALHDAERNFVDLSRITYQIETSRGWTEHGEQALRNLVRKRGWSEDEPGTLIGWRWDEFDRVGYYVIWTDREPDDRELRNAIGENDYRIRYLIDRREGLLPGPCPIANPRPLLVQ